MDHARRRLSQNMATTLRACLRAGCGHGASAHKNRQGNYVLYRAECEHCDCDEYIDPIVSAANHYDDEGRVLSAEELRTLKAPRQFIPEIHGKEFRVVTVEERRAYWRQKQQESRMRRRLAHAASGEE